MAENQPNPPAGAVPPKPAESAKVQPKKETVRITLPPKPTAAPTVRLPSMAPGAGATTASMAAPAAAAPAPAAPSAATATAPTLPMRPGTAVAPATSTAARPQAQTPARQPAPAAAVVRPAFTTLDLSLAIAAAVVGLAVLVGVILLANIPT
jgi:hypothetical protein